ncbi:hypothetical protein MKEN_00388100 [Mycena kentingensis (nom. inval.)]|nr:hypothetical protein MKEN_00388100 [Mycena kentingensis (nom. inval.)]
MASPLVDFQCSSEDLDGGQLEAEKYDVDFGDLYCYYPRNTCEYSLLDGTAEILDDGCPSSAVRLAEAQTIRATDTLVFTRTQTDTVAQTITSILTFSEPPATSFSIVPTTIALSGSLTLTSTLTTTLVSTVSILQSTSPVLTSATPLAMIGLAVIVGIQSIILLPILFLFCRRRWRARRTRTPDAEEGNFIVQRVCGDSDLDATSSTRPLSTGLVVVPVPPTPSTASFAIGTPPMVVTTLTPIPLLPAPLSPMPTIPNPFAGHRDSAVPTVLSDADAISQEAESESESEERLSLGQENTALRARIGILEAEVEAAWDLLGRMEELPAYKRSPASSE